MDTRMNERTLPEVTVAVNFTAAAPQTQSVPEDLLDTEQTQALVTVAALFGHPNVRVYDEGGKVTGELGTDQTQSVAFLALFAAGAKVRLSKQQFRGLDATAREYAQHGGLDAETSEYVMFTVRQAVARAQFLGIIGQGPNRQDGLADVDFETGRGYGVMDTGLRQDFDATASRQERLLTYAALFSHANVARTNSGAQAVVYMALFAMDARVSLTVQQFRQLERRVRNYLHRMSATNMRDLPNGRRAHYVLAQARRRARRNKLIN
jgi:hypothetical protein